MASEETASFELKYGCNPHQTPAVCSLVADEAGRVPFKVLNGTPGFINVLDAVGAWALVCELSGATGATAAASFKHVSPAGAAIDAVPLSAAEAAAYEISDPSALTGAGLAYVRARNADPKSSFGDFIAISGVVDAAAARIIKSQVADGIIAGGFEDAALEVLAAKKGGRFVVLEGDAAYEPPAEETRVIRGVRLSQGRNTAVVTPESVVQAWSGPEPPSEDAVRDLVVASVTIKHTQSNSVGLAVRGQMIGIGAGQQSRIDCTQIACDKAAVWWLRQHPQVLGLAFKKELKRQDRVNARVEFLSLASDPETTAATRAAASVARFYQGLAEASADVAPLAPAERAAFISKAAATAGGVALCSDAFFPFRDSIDTAALAGVRHVIQPGGSIRDDDVAAAAGEYGMTMVCNGVRSFLH